MKKIIISTTIILCFVLTMKAQKTTDKNSTVSDKETISSGLQNFPWKVTTCAEELLNSYNRLASGTGLQSCAPKIYSVTGYMPAGCFSLQPDSGYITFSSSYDFTYYNVAVFRTIFDFYPPYYSYYGSCIPDPIAWSVPENATTENDLYEAFLISVKDYKNSPDKSYSYLRSSSYVILSDKFNKIVTWGYESKNGYIATYEPGNYNNVLSSKGLQVEIKLNTGELVWCYLMNSYDGAGTITWKEPTSSGTEPDITADNETTEAANMNVKLTTASLQQNQPNPFKNSTVVSYTLPAKFTTAKIKITDFTGRIIKEINLNTPGKGTINLDATSLAGGTYSYALYVDDGLIESKRMVIVK